MPDLFLVTMRSLPKSDQDLSLLTQALEKHTISYELVAWDDPSVDWGSASLCLIRTPWDYFQRPHQFVAWARKVAQHTTLWNPADIVAWNFHKRYLLELAAQQVPVIPTTLIEAASIASLDEHLHNLPWQDVVVKPAISIGALGAGRFQQSDPALYHHCLDLLQAGNDILIQPFQPEILTSGEISLIFFAGNFSHAALKRGASDEYRVQDHYGGTVTPYTPTKEELHVAQHILTLIGPTLPYTRIDLLPTTSGPLVMEVELIEPTLFLDQDLEGPTRFAALIAHHLQTT